MWVFISLIEKEAEGSLGKTVRGKAPVMFLGSFDAAVIYMCQAVRAAVKQSGRTVTTVSKMKMQKMSDQELERVVRELIEKQEGRCKLTGLRFQIGPEANEDYAPSLDRIDSDKHYEHGNLQVVCRFVNFWKGDRDNDVFKALLAALRNGGPNNLN